MRHLVVGIALLEKRVAALEDVLGVQFCLQASYLILQVHDLALHILEVGEVIGNGSGVHLLLCLAVYYFYRLVGPVEKTFLVLADAQT